MSLLAPLTPAATIPLSWGLYFGRETGSDLSLHFVHNVAMQPEEIASLLQKRSRFTSRGLRRFGDGILVETEQGLYSLDLAAKKLTRFTHIEDKEVLSVASFQGGALVLCRDSRQLTLLSSAYLGSAAELETSAIPSLTPIDKGEKNELTGEESGSARTPALTSSGSDQLVHAYGEQDAASGDILSPSDARLPSRSFLPQQNAWREIELPDVLRPVRRARPVLLADDKTIVLLQSGSIAFYRDGVWKLSPWRREEASLIESKRYALQGDTLWIATNRGEFGGGLVSYDLLQEQITPTPGHFGVRATPVTMLKQNPGGALWFSEGLHTMGRERGGLYRRRGDEWECFFYCSHLPLHQLTIIHPTQSWNDIADKERGTLLGSFTDWNLPSCAIDSFDFMVDGTPVVLTARFGPVAFDGQDWRPLFAWWPYTQVVDLLISSEDVFVIATLYAGVLLWDKKKNELHLVS